MSRDPYRASTGDLGSARSSHHWDVIDERSRDRSGGREVVRLEERDDFHAPRHDRLSQDFVREREVYVEEPHVLPMRSRRQSVVVDREREREYYRSPSPPVVRRVVRPETVVRRRSMDTFDRRPRVPRYVERVEYGPPVKRYYEEDLRVYPERVRETEIVRRRRSRSSSRSSSSSSSSSSARSRRSEFPKRGKTRMPARFVSKRAIIELGYPFEEEVRPSIHMCHTNLTQHRATLS